MSIFGNFKTRCFTGLFILIGSCVEAQEGWTWTELPSMPQSVSNNAVAAAYCGDTLCVYSFCGIDSTKTPDGIHLKSWRFNTVSQVWTSLPDVPDFQGKIAAAASVINNLIYVVGGYYVYPNFSEESSNDIHIFDPEAGMWLDDGAVLPIAIDDHVQAVYNDSLLFVVTGWSNTANVPSVQVYDPVFDSWTLGTSLPNQNTYKAFGASGAFVGDTLFYMGGVSSGNFAANGKFRKGVVDASNPTSIEWELLDDFPYGVGYRMAAAQFEDRVFWMGGAGVAYNFDGIAYDGSGGVNPEPRIATYYSNYGIWEEGTSAPHDVMDLRGVAKLTDTSWVLCGGMGVDQEVGNRVFLLELDPTVGIRDVTKMELDWKIVGNEIRMLNVEEGRLSLLDLSGRTVVENDSGSLTFSDGMRSKWWMLSYTSSTGSRSTLIFLPSN